MKYIESWMSEWVKPDLSRDDICHALTMAGLEVEEVVPASQLEPAKGTVKDDDHIIDLSITPNRGDCLSIKGVAREIAAITESPMLNKPIPAVAATIKDIVPISINAKAECPRYVGRVIREVNVDTQSPIWLQERLRLCGIRSINPVVDVTNYVMLEIGQPMHAFDLEKITQGIHVRLSSKGERLTLLDGTEKELDAETLVIADEEKVLAIAGVMGGLDSSVTLTTKDILLESAYFTAAVIARQRQYYNLNSDSSYRFERGIDFAIQIDAIERATQLILEIAGGKAGPIIERVNAAEMPPQKEIHLSSEQITKLLGANISARKVESVLTSLGMHSRLASHGADHEDTNWSVQVPTYRPDINIPEDLIEEVARLYGYNEIPEYTLRSDLHSHARLETSKDLHNLRQSLSDMGYHEIVSYSFVEKSQQQLLDPNESVIELVNPITADMSVMRTNLLPGLINTLRYNKSRQQHRVRLFELGDCFLTRPAGLQHQPRIAGLIAGLAQPEQWGITSREVDFFDMKGDICNLLSLYFPAASVAFIPSKHPALHPGQSADILIQDNNQSKTIGYIGALHPSILQALDITGKVFVFEIDTKSLERSKSCSHQEVSKFPEIRRDIAILVNQAIPSKEIQDIIRVCVGDWLNDVFIFDVYQGKGITPGFKSVALAIIFQHPTRTLVDDEIAAVMEKVLTELKGKLGAELRS